MLFDLTANAEQLSPVNNEYPEAFTVSRKLAEENPEIVTAFVKQVVRTTQWAKTNYDEALTWLAKQTYATRSQAAASYAFDSHKHLDLSLSDFNLSVLEGQKRFLMEFGEVELAHKPDCPVCGENPSITSLIDYEQAVCDLREYHNK
jgi:ABC-type nitrate/sulfonate/bicarbonate transport system substrate-binding protein